MMSQEDPDDYVVCSSVGTSIEDILKKSFEYIGKISSEPRQKIYASVIFSHLGMLEYMKKNYQQAKEYFELGLKTNAKQPLVRGTYTWLNKMGLALTYHKLNYLNEAQDLLEKAQKEMRLPVPSMLFTNISKTINRQ